MQTVACDSRDIAEFVVACVCVSADMETWMYPNLLFFHPKLAQGTVPAPINRYVIRILAFASLCPNEVSEE